MVFIFTYVILLIALRAMSGNLDGGGAFWSLARDSLLWELILSLIYWVYLNCLDGLLSCSKYNRLRFA